MAYFGQPLTQQDIYSPPAYYDRMAYDPTQPPVQMGWGQGYGPQGPWPGFYLGQRTITQEEADRIARERQNFMEMRAEVSEDPSHKYLSPQGLLRPKIAAALQAAQKAQEKQKKDPAKEIQKKILITVLVGAILTALLK